MRLDLSADELDFLAAKLAERVAEKIATLNVGKPDGPEFLTINEAAALLGIERHVLYDAARKTGELTAVRFGKTWRVTRPDLLAWGRRRAEEARKSSTL
jgi:excisionase family DNA binding protein